MFVPPNLRGAGTRVGALLACAVAAVGANASPLAGAAGAELTAGPARKLADGFRFTEGPAWDGRGGLYFSDLPNRTLHRWTAADGVTLIRRGEEFSNGVVVDPAGNLLFCETSGHRVVRRTPGGVETTLADRCDGRPLDLPNDLWLAPDGAVFFTVPKTKADRAGKAPAGAVNGVVCRIPPGGSAATVAADLTSPNGVVGSADGTRLYVAVPGSRQCVRFDIAADGSLSNRTVAADKASDGLTLDERGNLYVTDAAGVAVYSPDAVRVALIPVPEAPANMTFGGADGRTLFVTARTGLYAVPMRVRGDAFTAPPETPRD